MRTYPLLFLVLISSAGASVSLKKKKKLLAEMASLKATIGRSLVCFFVALPFLVQAQVRKNQPYIDSLLYELSVSKDDTNKVNTLGLLSYTYSTINPDKGIKYGHQALQLAEQLQWKAGQASSYGELAINYEARSQHAKALGYNLKALSLFKELNNHNGIAATLANLSLVYMAQGRYDKAMEYAFKSLGVEGGIIDRTTTAVVTENIGTIYLEQKNYPKTIQYYSMALDTYRILNDKTGIARNLGNMGIVHDATGNHPKALVYHQQALQLNKELGNQTSIQINLANIGYVYSHMKSYDQALENQQEALRISKELKIESSVAINIGNIGETYFEMASDASLLKDRKTNLTMAISYLEEAIRICKKINFPGPAAEYCQYLAEAYYMAGRHKNAFLTYKDHIALKESIFSHKNQLDLTRIEAQREIDLKNKSIIIKNKELEINKLVAANKRNERIIYISVIGLITIVTLVAIREYQRRSRIHRETLANIARIQSHDLRGPLATILGLAQLFNHDSPSDPVNKKVIDSITITCKKLDEIIRNIVTKTST